MTGLDSSPSWRQHPPHRTPTRSRHPPLRAPSWRPCPSRRWRPLSALPPGVGTPLSAPPPGACAPPSVGSPTPHSLLVFVPLPPACALPPVPHRAATEGCGTLAPAASARSTENTSPFLCLHSAHAHRAPRLRWLPWRQADGDSVHSSTFRSSTTPTGSFLG